MEIFKGLNLSSPRAQVMAILLAALKNLKGTNRKKDVIAFIRSEKWFDIQPEDLTPYPSQDMNEKRWETLVAWARLDASKRELMEKSEHDAWAISKDGWNAVVLLKLDFLRVCFKIAV